MNFEEKNRILKSVMEQIEPERTARKRAQIKKLSSIAAVLAVVLLLGACTVKVFHLDDKIAAVIGGTTPSVESAATVIDAVDEHDGIRIEGKQIVSDGKLVFISFDVVSLTDLTFRYDNTFAEHYMWIDDYYPSMGAIHSISSVSEDGKTMSLVFEANNTAIVGEHKIKLCMNNMIENHNTERIIAEGSWEIEFDYTCEALMRTMHSDDNIVVEGNTLSIDKLDISPLSLHLDLTLVKSASVPAEEWWFINTFEKVEILLKDGSSVMVAERNAGWTDEGENQWGKIDGRPANFINVDDVVGLSFDGQKIDLK